AEQSAAEVALMEIVESIPTIGRIPAANVELLMAMTCILYPQYL
uniref:Uncharacterized protein n=1 Tax=Aegilops tauschii subsp. strangulata TaxID=200361 RepID=A0A453HRT9_AEGTS